MKLQIAIDGPASAGKSTVAKLVAKKLGYVYCDTGAMYRATTYAAKKNHVAYDDDQGLKEMLEKTEIRFVPAEPEQKVFVNETEVTKTIRLPEIANNVSTVSAQKSVRADLTERQRMIAEIFTSGMYKRMVTNVRSAKVGYQVLLWSLRLWQWRDKTLSHQQNARKALNLN